jgi:hypothetical protein
MIDIAKTNIRRNWEECPRDAKENRWATLYATRNSEGDLVISRFTHETLGSPDSYLLLYDRERDVIGLKPARGSVEKNAYPARLRGRHGGRRMRAYRLCREFGIQVLETVRFHRCRLDNDGILLLDLRDTRPAGKQY